jgi:hypothetical protein
MSPASSTPQIVFASTKLADDHFHTQDDSECNICTFKDAPEQDDAASANNSIIKIDVCNHVYHEVCIKTWLSTQLQTTHGTCPMSRTVIIHNPAPRDAQQVARNNLMEIMVELERLEEQFRAILARINTDAVNVQAAGRLRTSEESDRDLEDLLDEMEEEEYSRWGQ